MSTLRDQIIAGHEADQPFWNQPVTSGALPLNYEALTAEWLTEVLCRDGRGAAVTGFVLGERDDGTANRRRIMLEYNAAGKSAGLPESVFCKASHDLLHRINLGLSGAAHCEVTFYRKLRSDLKIDTPQAFFADYDPVTFNSLIMLNDIADDVRFCDQTSVLNWEQAVNQVTLLAELHGHFAANSAAGALAAGAITWPQFFAGCRSNGLEDATRRGFEAAEEVIPRALFSKGDKVWDATVRAVEEHDHLPVTLVHGDCHLKQWYMRGSFEMGVSDWQCCTVGNWARDLPYMLGTSLTVDQRRTWERDLLILYTDLLIAKGIEMGGFDQVWRLYRRNILPALAWWTGTLCHSEGQPEMQPRETSIVFIERLACLADDLDAIGALSD